MMNMNIVIVGHVDHGKSTIIGRLLADTDSLPQGKLAQVKETCRRNSKPFEYAFLLDALKDEQAQGITIDAARVFFKTQKRKYIIIDAPGHIEFLKNMVTGAARAEAALLVIDANEGVMENSKRHGYLLSMLGIKQVVVLVNKMDLIDYSQARYQQTVDEYGVFLKQIGVEAEAFIPISGFMGDNVAIASEKMPWYRGHTVLETLDLLQNKNEVAEEVFRMPVQSVYKFTAGGDDRRIVAGTIDTGKVQVGDEVIFYPSGKRSKVKSIERFNADKRESDIAGSATGFTLEEQIYVTRGELACIAGERQPQVSPRIKAKLFWLGKEDLNSQRSYFLKLGTQKVRAELEQVITVLDASTLANTARQYVQRHEVAEVIFSLQKPIAFDQATDLNETSRFVLVDNFEISGGGIIVESLAATVRNHEHISPAERAARYAQRPLLLLVSGAKGLEKRALATHLEKSLFREGRHVFYLETMQQEIAKALTEAGNLVITTVDDIRQNELEILKKSLEVKVIWLGDMEMENLSVDLQVDEYETQANVYAQVKQLLVDAKAIFVPY